MFGLTDQSDYSICHFMVRLFIHTVFLVSVNISVNFQPTNKPSFSTPLPIGKANTMYPLSVTIIPIRMKLQLHRRLSSNMYVAMCRQLLLATENECPTLGTNVNTVFDVLTVSGVSYILTVSGVDWPCLIE